MQKRLVLGLSTCHLPPTEQPRVYNGRALIFAEKSMLSWLLERGEDVVMLPWVPGMAQEQTLALARRQAHMIDALILHGGADMAPQSYGQAPEHEAWHGDALRDAHDIALIQACYKEGVPILGICRGHQALNVALGGTLHQDIGAHFPGALVHRDAGLYQHNHHAITLRADGALSALYGGITQGEVNSVHHQSIDQLAPPLREEARAEDGIVEAVSCTDPARFAMGVQWHPEFQSAQDRAALLSPAPLLAALIQAARTRIEAGA